jgi:probable phosphoglycerate mutase
MKLYLIRHVESKGNIRKFMSSPKDSITKRGKSQAISISKSMKNKSIEIIYSSDLKRAVSTSKELAKEMGIKVIYTSLLRERSAGVFSGKQKKKAMLDALKNGKDYLSHRPKNGENFYDVIKRAKKILDVLKKKKYKRAIIVSHSGTIKAIMVLTSNMQLNKVRKTKIRNAKVIPINISI